MGNFKYSIIYAIIRPEISEQVSLGLITVFGEQVNVRISRNKLKVLKGLFPEKEYRFISRVVGQMTRNGSIDSICTIDYLSRYSNNLIAFSPLAGIDVEPTKSNQDRLFRKYVYNGARA